MTATPANVTLAQVCRMLGIAQLGSELVDLEVIAAKDRKPTARRQWAIFRRIALKAEPSIRLAFLKAVTRTQAATKVPIIARLVKAGDLDGAAAAVPWREIGEPVLQTEFARQLRVVFEATGQRATELLDDKAQFSILQPRALEVMQEVGGARIVQLSDSVVSGVRGALYLMAEHGLSAQETATLIRPQIGLIDASDGQPHGPYTNQAVTNFITRLDKDGFDAETIAREASRYATQLRQGRALNIARNEAAEMSAAGRQASWQQAIDDGLIEAGEWVKRWNTNPNSTHEECMALDGMTVGLDESFPGGVDMDPLHTACVCAVTIERET